MATAFVYDSFYLQHDTGDHPENFKRITVILATLESEKELISTLVSVPAKNATQEDLERCHNITMIDFIREQCEKGTKTIDFDTNICPISFDVALRAAGGAIASVDAVMDHQADNAFAALRPPGHHATRNVSMGFCLFNNAAIAARYAQTKYGVKKVLIVDWDLHHGNGTQDIFYEDSSVFFFSMHQHPFYPGTGAAGEKGHGRGEGYTLNIPIPGWTPAAECRRLFSKSLRTISKSFYPDQVIISAGFDSRADDPLGDLLFEDEDFREMTLEVMDLADKYASGRVVSLLEGGYNLETLGSTVKTHLQTLVKG